MDGLLHSGTKVLTAHGSASRCHNGESAGQKTLLSQTVKCWNELALGQITRGSEDNHGAGLRRALQTQTFPQGIFDHRLFVSS